MRTVEVPEGCKAIIVSDQLLSQYERWVYLGNVEARVVPTDDRLVVDVEARRVGMRTK